MTVILSSPKQDLITSVFGLFDCFQLLFLFVSPSDVALHFPLADRPPFFSPRASLYSPQSSIPLIPVIASVASIVCRTA